MKKIILLFLTIVISVSAQNYKQVKIFFNNLQEAQTLYKAVPDIERGFYNRRDNSVTVFVDEKQFAKIKSEGFNYKILINDWAEYYRNRAKKVDRALLNEQVLKSRNKFGVKGFSFGSMGGFLTFNEVVRKLDSMRIEYPNLITAKKSLGRTIEGRDIWMVKISDNPDVDEDEPEVFFNSLIHAREPEGMMAMLYYMYYLLENYNTDPLAKYIVDNREIYFVPVFNADGYEYNHRIAPDGGGMWRKNRRVNPDSSYGVDLNRNWGYKWGYSNNGSSGETTSQTYRGTAPFSEPETQAVRQFCNAHNFKTACNIHTYSDLIIFPWGYIPEETPDSLVYREYGEDMSRYNGYTYGISEDIIYLVNGDADDWMYGEQTEKNKIISMTFEIGSGSDGFWPPQSRIYPLAEENLKPFMYLSLVAGGFTNLKDYSLSQSVFLPGDTFTFTPVVKNKGLGTANDLSFELEAVTPYISVQDTVVTLDSLSSRAVDTLKTGFKITIANDAPVGKEQKFVFKTTLEGVEIGADTVAVVIGQPLYIFLDRCDTLTTHWKSVSNTSLKWTTTEATYHSAPACFTDSKNTDYRSNSKVKLTSTDYFDLTGIENPRLSFWTKFRIERGWDYGQVMVGIKGQTYWTPVGGKLSQSGAGQFQPYGEPVYSGSTRGWQREEIDLSAYKDKTIKIRFQLNSDEYVEKDGWYLDDIAVFHYVLSKVEKTDEILNSYKLYQNYPNPFGAGGETSTPITTIKYSIPAVGTAHELSLQLIVYDILGREVTTLVDAKQTPGVYSVKFNASSLPSGIYFYRLKAGNFSAVKKMILIK